MPEEPVSEAATDVNRKNSTAPLGMAQGNEADIPPKETTSAGVANLRTIELADFIYRDNHRISSLYAQLFNGLLINNETTDTLIDSTERGLGLAAVVTGALKNSKGVTRSTRETRQPHDALAADLIASLSALGRISDDTEAACAGDIVRSTGTLFLINRQCVRIGINETIARMGTNLRERQGTTFGDITNREVADADLSDCYALLTKESMIFGTLVPDGLHEPINSIYFKHGTNGVVDMGMIGIKEQSEAHENSAGVWPFGTGSHLYAAQLQNPLIWSESSRRVFCVSPLLIYRRVR